MDGYQYVDGPKNCSWKMIKRWDQKREKKIVRVESINLVLEVIDVEFVNVYCNFVETENMRSENGKLEREKIIPSPEL